jgi:hypothetical protein
MFDKYFIREGVRHQSVDVKIKEERAPTDESLRLLKEMEKEVRNEIVESIAIDDNYVNGSITIFDIDPFMRHYRCVVSFKLNGRKYLVEKTLERVAFDIEGHAVMLRTLYEVVADEIAKQMLTAGVGEYVTRTGGKGFRSV